VKTWTHLPEKPLSKNKGTRSARAMSQLKADAIVLAFLKYHYDTANC